MASSTKEEFAQMIAQLEDSGQNGGVCIMAEMKKDRNWEQLYHKEHKLRQEAEGELTIIKGIGNNSPEMKTLKKRVEELENSLSIAVGIKEKK
tara:strand:+ start:315 stop:593 length:279 start_codon:yes stop_codon:yes gene_type:complete